MTTGRPHALIVGAGIGGLSAAWWLDKAGWNSTIIERAASIRPGGYIMSLSGLGYETLKRMNLKDKLEGVSYQFGENVIKDSGGRELLRLRYADVHGGSDVDNMAVCRDDLAGGLAAALPETATIRFGEELASAVDDGSKVRAKLKSGEEMEADLLIGADGIRSSVRDEFWKGENCLENLGYSFATYDLHEKKELECSCVSYNCPGHLDILYALRDDRVAALHVWRDDQPKRPDPSRPKFDLLREVVTGDVPLISEVMESAEKGGASPLVDSLSMVVLSKWSKGRIVLLGDAACCITFMSGQVKSPPYVPIPTLRSTNFSQGAGMALASAEILANELKATADVPKALENWEKKLRPVIERLQKRSRTLAAMYIPKNKLVYTARSLVLKFMPYSFIVRWHAKSLASEINLMKEEAGTNKPSSEKAT